MTVYRSGLRYRPPLANGGHSFVLIVESSAYPRLWDPPYDGPPLWRCVHCYGIVPEWAIRERFLRPCTGTVAALVEAPQC